MSDLDIAAEFHLGEATVKTHVGRVLAKLGCTNAFRSLYSPTGQPSSTSPCPVSRFDGLRDLGGPPLPSGTAWARRQVAVESLSELRAWRGARRRCGWRAPRVRRGRGGGCCAGIFVTGPGIGVG
ncbi:LuxR C-terminal-related transcriptional regulator [Amycolatopsis sp. WAC 01375]|uniref:LuxR C-terminal-related transcriptional regulator n=1 Tax=Amycolatopsis sp. WAC 01375 TaxID=2203194 RepID=UPI001F313690|nr:LuxR C-terminal-related transcriptional regulator [Amycolatopsis sp. WAC 01375]